MLCKHILNSHMQGASKKKKKEENLLYFRGPEHENMSTPPERPHVRIFV